MYLLRLFFNLQFGMGFCELYEVLIKRGLATGTCKYDEICTGAPCHNPIAIDFIDPSAARAWSDEDGEQEQIVSTLERIKNANN